MLGDSVRRRSGKPASPRKPAAAKPRQRWTVRHWLLLVAALFAPFGIGYLIAVRLMFPPPPVVAAGIPVPSIVGETLEDAQRSVVTAGLGRLDVMQLPSPTAAVGSVIAQSPLAGQQLRNGARIRVAVSSGKPRVVVPDVIGFPVERAASLLSRLGFQVQRSDEVSDEPRGQIISINPSAGTQLELPARVSITVSQGPPEPVAGDTGIVRDTSMVSPRVGWSGRSESRILSVEKAVTPLERARSNGRE
jgi:eukaryotic-like serine/threonine-protein kinase